MARQSSLSGYLELLPQQRLVELHLLDTLRGVFERHGFSSLESRAIEPVEVLLRKGEIDKEVYAVSRIAETAENETREPSMALHFDLTVPFSRYVTENAGYLHFPFRRYQIQKVWRGERPQQGRFREFTQADIDIVGDSQLPVAADTDLAAAMVEALEALKIGDFVLRVNNRKLSEGFYRAIGIEDTASVLRGIDKLEKIGAAQVAADLVSEDGISEEQAQRALDLAHIEAVDSSFVSEVRALLREGEGNELLETGLEELAIVITDLRQRVPGRAKVDLAIARGLDYYTGTVFETTLIGNEKLGSICSGGRYESLASSGKRAFPGVGLSIGVTRLLDTLLKQETVTATRSVPTTVYVALPSAEQRQQAHEVASMLRSRGINTEVALTADKFGKQIRHADRRGIPYVWFPYESGDHEVKDIRSGEQVSADPGQWLPAQEDLAVTMQYASTASLSIQDESAGSPTS